MSNPEQNEQKTYRESLKDYWDIFSVTETAEKKGHKAGLAEGLAEGMEKGLEKGRETKVLEIATQMKQAGLPFAQISQFTGLSESVIESL